MRTQIMVRKEHEALEKLGIKHKFIESPQGSWMYGMEGYKLGKDSHLAWSPQHGLYMSPSYTITIDKNADDRAAGAAEFKRIIDTVKSLG